MEDRTQNYDPEVYIDSVLVRCLVLVLVLVLV